MQQALSLKTATIQRMRFEKDLFSPAAVCVEESVWHYWQVFLFSTVWYCLCLKARHQFTDCYATVQMFNYHAQMRRKWMFLYHVVSDKLLQTFHNKVGCYLIWIFALTSWNSLEYWDYVPEEQLFKTNGKVWYKTKTIKLLHKLFTCLLFYLSVFEKMLKKKKSFPLWQN